MTYKELRNLIHSDMERYASEIKSTLTWKKKLSFLLLPCIICLINYRISHYFFSNGHYLAARFFYTINIMMFGLDIAPSSDIGSHMYLPHPVGIIMVCNAGHHCTFFARTMIGGGMKELDIGAGMGLPILGNHVQVGGAGKILGPVRIGDNSRIGADSLVLSDIPENSTVIGSPARCV